MNAGFRRHSTGRPQGGRIDSADAAGGAAAIPGDHMLKLALIALFAMAMATLTVAASAIPATAEAGPAQVEPAR